MPIKLIASACAGILAMAVLTPAYADSVFGDVKVTVVDDQHARITWIHNGYSMVAGPVNESGNGNECRVEDVLAAIDQEGIRGDYTKIDRQETPIGDIGEFMMFLTRNTPGTGISVNLISCNRNPNAPLVALCGDLEGTADRLNAGLKHYGPEGCFRASLQSQQFTGDVSVSAAAPAPLKPGTVFGEGGN